MLLLPAKIVRALEFRRGRAAMAAELHLNVASRLGLSSCPSLCYFVLPLAPQAVMLTG